MVPDSCGLSEHTRSLFEKAKLSISTYPGAAMSYTVLQDWAKIGMGAAILPVSKLHADTPIIPIVNRKGAREEIEYFAIWKDQNLLNSASKAFCGFLIEVAPRIAYGLETRH